MLKTAIVFIMVFQMTTLAYPTPALFCEKPLFDFGEADNRENVQTAFQLKNSGDAALIIEKVKPACGCTVAEMSSNELAPGEEATLEVTLSLDGRIGKVSKSIQVYSNDPDTPVLRLTMSGVATSPVNTTPRRLDFGKLTEQSEGAKQSDLTIDASEVLNILEVVSDSENLKARVQTIVPGTSYRIHVELVPPLSLGRLNTKVRLHTDSADFPTIEIPVSATVADAIAYTLSYSIRAGCYVQNFRLWLTEFEPQIVPTDRNKEIGFIRVPAFFL